mmetsp:Transcript_8603/g.13430  ORF Transcript_8603/g.13430 Transcript_8603/m.13430 type:complete len:181 (+) Transcript_8603:120-662(+)
MISAEMHVGEGKSNQDLIPIVGMYKRVACVDDNTTYKKNCKRFKTDHQVNNSNAIFSTEGKELSKVFRTVPKYEIIDQNPCKRMKTEHQVNHVNDISNIEDKEIVDLHGDITTERTLQPADPIIYGHTKFDTKFFKYYSEDESFFYPSATSKASDTSLECGMQFDEYRALLGWRMMNVQT